MLAIWLTVPALIVSAGVATADPGQTPSTDPATPTEPVRSRRRRPLAMWRRPRHATEPAASEPGESGAPSTAGPEPQHCPRARQRPSSRAPRCLCPGTGQFIGHPEAAAPESVGALAVVTTSGVLRDARTGASIPSSCVAYRNATASQTNFSNVNQDGTFSFQTDDVDGPVNIAFYVVADFDCRGPVCRPRICRPGTRTNRSPIPTRPQQHPRAAPPRGRSRQHQHRRLSSCRCTANRAVPHPPQHSPGRS